MIFLSCKEDLYTYNTYHLVKAFFPEEDVRQSVVPTLAPVFRMEFPDGQVLTVEDSELAAMEDRKQRKYVVDVKLYNACRSYTQKELAWGILTGVRPTKLAMQKLNEGMDEEQFVDWFTKDSFVSLKKARLAYEIAGREKQILSGLDCENGYSLYVGIPFCPSVCSYCSFSSGSAEVWKDYIEPYLEALLKELSYIGEQAKRKNKKLNTIYIGGGTPTTLNERQLDRLLTHIDRTFSRDFLLEYTVELPEITQGIPLPNTAAIWKMDIETGIVTELLKYTDLANFEPRVEIAGEGIGA